MDSYWSKVLPGRVLIAQCFDTGTGTDIALVFTDSDGREYDSDTYRNRYNGNINKAVQAFFDEEAGIAAGFLDEDGDQKEVDESFWGTLKAKADPDRSLRIETFGNKFKKYKNYAGVQRKFNALVINSKRPSNVDLRTARGTDECVQKCVQSGTRFQEVMTNMVNVIERDNLTVIGIYCRAGHHRSVACGELLKKHIYPGSTVKHLTIH